MPSGALLVDDEEFERYRQSGWLIPVPPDMQETRQREALRDQQAKAVVDDFVAEHPEFEKRFYFEPPDHVTRLDDGNYVTTLPGGKQVVLTGQRQLLRDAAATIRAMNDRENRLETLVDLYPLMPPDCKDIIPPQENWQNMSASELAAAADKLTDCWADSLQPNGEELVTIAGAESPPVISDESSEQIYSDSSDDCYANPNDPSSYLKPEGLTDYTKNYLFKYLSPVRDQGRRGTCVTFATASAMEQWIARHYGRRTNLSEQAIYVLGKAILYGEWYEDGLPTVDFLEDVRDLGWALPFEPVWPYNRALKRPKGDTAFHNVCADYDFPICSETSHETVVICNKKYPIFCDYWTAGYYNGYSVPNIRVIEDFEDDDMNEALAYISAGHSVVLSVTVTQAFKDLKSIDFVAGENDTSSELGGHAVHAVAVGGLFPSMKYVLIKNSWGCGWGDRGFAWVPVKWIQEHFRSIVLVSANREGINYSPEVEIIQPQTQSKFPYGGFPPEPVKFKARTNDIEDGQNCCTVEWESTLDGYMGTGHELDYVFKNPGLHIIKATATDSEGVQDIDYVVVELTNQPPQVAITAPIPLAHGEPVWIYKGLTTMFFGKATDPNQPLGIPCGSFEWSSSNSSDAVPSGDCAVPIKFDTLGQRTITLEVADELGQTGSASVTVKVVDPPPDMDPNVVIVEPQNGEMLAPDSPNLLKAVVDNPGGQTLTYRWEWRRAGTSDAFSEIAPSKTYYWKPTVVPFHCGGQNIELRFTATNGTQDFSQTITVMVAFPPC